MTRTTIFTALRFILSLAMTSPAQAWPGPAGIAPRPNAGALVREPHPHVRNMAHATRPLPPATRLHDRPEDPLASMHFE